MPRRVREGCSRTISVRRWTRCRAHLRPAAIALLGQMVTSAGTRNVISAADLFGRVSEDDAARVAGGSRSGARASQPIKARATRAPARPRSLRDHERVSGALDQPAPSRAPAFAGAPSRTSTTDDRRSDRRGIVARGRNRRRPCNLGAFTAKYRAQGGAHDSLACPCVGRPGQRRRPDSMSRSCSRWPRSRHIEPVRPVQRSLAAA